MSWEYVKVWSWVNFIVQGFMWQHKFKGTLNFRLTADAFLNN